MEKDEAATAVEAPRDEAEDRVEEYAVQTFEHLGFKGRLPDDLVRIYLDFKRTKDRLRPGRLSDEGFATVLTLYGLFGR